jgi:hypothetical protein
MNLLLSCVALAYFGVIAVIAEGKPANPNTLKSNKNKRGLNRR